MKPTLLISTSVLLFLCAFGAIAGAGIYSYFQPRLYSSAAEFQLFFPAEDALRLDGAFRVAQEKYPARMQQPLTSGVSLVQAGAEDRYRITALDIDPYNAANAANILTISVMESLESSKDLERVKVLQKAERALRPSLPDVQGIMKRARGAAAVCAAAGGVLLVLALNRRKSEPVGR